MTDGGFDVTVQEFAVDQSIANATVNNQEANITYEQGKPSPHRVRLQILLRVGVNIVHRHGVMQMRPCHEPGGPHLADGIP